MAAPYQTLSGVVYSAHGPVEGVRLTFSAVDDNGRPVSGCLREGARSYAKPDPRHGPPIQEARTFLALLAQLVLRADVPVERHRPDAEFADTVRTPTCRGAPSRPGPAAPGLSTARTSSRPCDRGPVRP